MTPKQRSHEMGLSARQLPVRLAPYPDELLSSWIIRHAAFYAVPQLAMLQHCLPEIQSLRTAVLDITESQVARIAHMFSADPATVLRMTFSNITQSSRRLIASVPRQLCCSCSPITNELHPVLRSRFLGWRITCPLCGNLLQNADGVPRSSPFSRYHNSALIGEQLLDNEAELGMQNWMPPSEVARLLLMRRVPRPLPDHYEPSSYRVLGVIIPDLDNVLRVQNSELPSRASTVLPLHLRPALLAGVAIVQRSGPEMLHMLRSHLMGENIRSSANACFQIILEIVGTVLGEDTHARPLACLIEFGKRREIICLRLTIKDFEQRKAVVGGAMPLMEVSRLVDQVAEFRTLEAA